MLEDRIKTQIERNLGRELLAEELSAVPSLRDLAPAQVSLGRLLAGRQLILCVEYLSSLVPPITHRTAMRFIRDVLDGGGDVAEWNGDR